jgi:DNA-directed RNA polymerase specialized sigma24 family protein
VAKRKETRSDESQNEATGLRADQVERLTNLIALLLIKGEPQADQIRTLVSAGFSNTEIARLLALTPNAVNVALHRIRKRK